MILNTCIKEDDGSNNTSLFLVLINGHFNIVKYLVEECEVDPNIKSYGYDRKGGGCYVLFTTPLNIALRERIVEHRLIQSDDKDEVQLITPFIWWQMEHLE